MNNLYVTKKQYSKLKATSNNTKISSEIHNFFSEITGAESEDLIMQVIENDKRLAALKAYAMTA